MGFGERDGIPMIRDFGDVGLQVFGCLFLITSHVFFFLDLIVLIDSMVI